MVKLFNDAMFYQFYLEQLNKISKTFKLHVNFIPKRETIMDNKAAVTETLR